MTNYKLIFWACDYSEKTGEGNLARKFIKENYNNKKTKINTFRFKNFLNYKYILPYVLVINCWRDYLRGYKVGYLNYLPLWNFPIFLLLPPKTILGPITGGAFFTKKNSINFFIRKFIFPIFYKISELILNLRFKKKIFFSTDLLKKYLSNKTIQRCIFNFILNDFKFKKKRKIKDIDFIIYYRKHRNKLSFFNYQFLKKLHMLNFKIFVVGDKLDMKGVINLGFLSKKKISSLQSRSKYSLCSGENIYSLFILECITNHTKILVEKKYMNQIKFLKKYFIDLNDKRFNSKI